jgi:hypothetical protein
MKSILIAAAFSLIGFSALAQTTDAAPPAVSQPLPPPVGTLSTTRETHAADANGNRVDSQSTTYRDSQGVAQDRQTTSTTIAAPPPPPPATTTTTTTETTTAPR